jgi:hypothetical protein
MMLIVAILASWRKDPEDVHGILFGWRMRAPQAGDIRSMILAYATFNQKCSRLIAPGSPPDE